MRANVLGILDGLTERSGEGQVLIPSQELVRTVAMAHSRYWKKGLWSRGNLLFRNHAKLPQQRGAQIVERGSARASRTGQLDPAVQSDPAVAQHQDTIRK